MYMSYVRGIPTTWEFERDIVHYTSKNLWDWKFESILKLASDKVIDACISKLPNGLFRMWYKNERDNGYTYAADSSDLYKWEDKGRVIYDCSHEGPNVFFWMNKYWMVVDHWKGLGVYCSTDALNWERQGTILDKPGKRQDDGAYGHHADVLVQGERAFIFYFTHPGEDGIESGYERFRTSLQVAELEIEGGKLICDRDREFNFVLESEKDYSDSI
jgi:hypothetical protein